MCRFHSLSMHGGRKSEISSDEIEDYDTDSQGDLYSNDWEDEDWDDEPEEREYCD